MTRFIVDIYPEGFLLSGWIQRADYAPGSTERCVPHLQIQQRTFAWVLTRLADLLRQEPEATASVVKRMSPGQEGYERELDETTLRLLRSDPVTAIRSLNPEVKQAVFRSTLPAQADLTVRLQSGVETLARAIGEVLWLRRRADTIESPFNGRWVPYLGARLEHAVGESGTILSVGLRVPPPYAPTDSWVPVSTEALLATSTSRLYLPALTGGWVDKEQLQQWYQEYLNSKEQVCSRIASTQPTSVT